MIYDKDSRYSGVTRISDARSRGEATQESSRTRYVEEGLVGADGNSPIAVKPTVYQGQCDPTEPRAMAANRAAISVTCGRHSLSSPSQVVINASSAPR